MKSSYYHHISQERTNSPHYIFLPSSGPGENSIPDESSTHRRKLRFLCDKRINISLFAKTIALKWIGKVPKLQSCENTFTDVFKAAFPLVFSSVQFSHSVVSDSLWPHELQHARPPCPSATPRVYPNPCPLSCWCHPTISSSVIPFSFCPQSLPASGSFQMSQLFASGGQSIGVSTSTSILPMNTQDWSPSERTGWTSLQSKGLSRVFSNTTVQKHHFFGAQFSSQSNSHIHTWPLENHSLDSVDLCWQSNVFAFQYAF